ncbi:hypothetical protein Cantr_03947 [Candida viswanathii]|uniref:NADP-dependent oxidoreductase YfmJ n=1 Tax=Candida viswanathii TaxID=5486 RepID=A0A367XPL5_9ASCO|nr:hypothetical protein Cantr_03947 [Candida viswanathii]
MSIPKEATQIFLRACPTGFINPKFNEADSTFEIKQVPIPPLKDGEVLVKTLYLSNDPTQRTWLKKAGDSTPSYLPPVHEGTPMASFGIAEVVDSKSYKYVKGNVVLGRLYWADYAVLPDTVIFNKVDAKAWLPLEYYLSVLGMTTLTAYFGLTKVAELKNDDSGKGKIVLVSAAAGAVGSSVVQIAKHLLGASKVIGIASSDEKCQWIESLGADLGVNYKTKDWQKQIDDYLAKDDEGVDVYFDCVGGEMLSYALTKMNKFGHIALCGCIAAYNDPSALVVTTLFYAITKRLTLKGFIVDDFVAEFGEVLPVLADAIKDGKLKAEGSYHVEELTGHSITQRLEEIPAIWNLLFKGDKPKGKLLTKVA